MLTRFAGALKGLEGVPRVGVMVVVVEVVGVGVGFVDGTTTSSGSACSGANVGVST